MTIKYFGHANSSFSARMQASLRATLLAVGVLALGACNTLEGVGEDVERAGEAVQDASR